MEHYSKYSELIADSFDNFIRTLGNYIPSLLGALILLLVGFAIAWGLRWLILRLGNGIDRLYHRFAPASSPAPRWPVSRIVSGLVFWVVILFFATAAAESLSLPGLADWLNKLIAFLPSVLITAIIVTVGIVLGAYARDHVRSAAALAGLEQTELLGALVRLIILTLAVILGFQQLGLDIGIIEKILLLALAAFFAAVALAFGLGAGPTVTNIIAAHYVRKLYYPGQRIRINDLEGTLLELTPTAVILDTSAGRIAVPARTFSEHASLLLDVEPTDDA